MTNAELAISKFFTLYAKYGQADYIGEAVSQIEHICAMEISVAQMGEWGKPLSKGGVHNFRYVLIRLKYTNDLLAQAQEAYHSIPQKEPTPTENKHILPKPLKKEYDKIVKGYFERENQPINLSQIEAYKKEVIELGRKVVLHAKDNDIPKKDLLAFVQLKKMLNGYEKMEEAIGQLSFLASKVTAYKLSDNLREELEESLN